MKNHIVAIAAVGLMLIGFVIAWGIYRPKPAPPEQSAPAVRQKDGSLEIERAAGPGEKSDSPTPSLKPAGVIPKGAKVLRNIQVTVDPNIHPVESTVEKPFRSFCGRKFDLKAPTSAQDDRTATPCPRVTLNMSLIRLKDKTERVIASSPDGTVVGGLDVPVTEPTAFKLQRWTASGLAGYDSHAARNVFGGEVSYAKGPFVFSGGIIGGTAFVGGGIHF